jgi:NTP pyrophosphatase (non-canonical NTP hydrolase)
METMLKPHEHEALLILQEECAEVIQAVSKVFRFGIDNYKPGKPATNAEHLETEIGDVLCMIDILVTQGVIDPVKLDIAAGQKKEKLRTFSNIFKVKDGINYEG